MLNKKMDNINLQNDLYNIDTYRKKKKRKSLTKKVIIGIGILIIFALIYFTFDAVRQRISVKISDETSFPVEIKGEQPVDLSVIGDELIILGKSKNIFYTQGADKSGEILHSNVNPIVKINGNRILTYDPNGYNFRVDMEKNEVGQIKLNNKILLANINSNGYVGVVTFEDRFNGTLNIYDSKLNSIYKYSENSNYITDFNFVSNKKGLITMQSTENGKITSVIRMLDFTKEQDTVYFEKQYIGEVVYKTFYYDNMVYAFSNRAVIVLDSKGNEVNRYQYDGDLTYFDRINTNSIVFLKDIVKTGNVNIIILDEKNNEVASSSIQGDIKDVYCSDNRIVVLTSDKIYKFDYKLQKLDEIDNTSGYSQIAIIDEQIYAINSEYLYKVEKEKVE